MNNNSSLELPLITYNSLYNLLREEKKQKEKLQDLPEGYYLAVSKFIKNKEEEINKLLKLKNEEKLKKEERILKNSIRITEEIKFLRALKISRLVIEKEFFQEDLELNIKIQKEVDFLEGLNKLVIKFKGD